MKYDDASWVRILLVLAYLALLSCDKPEEEMTMVPSDFDSLSERSYEYLEAKQAASQKDFQIGTYERFDWDQEKMQLIWSDAGVPKVIAKIQFVGSISTKSNTWLWSWANPTVSTTLSETMTSVGDYGHTNGFIKLTDEKWAADEVDGWQMTAIAAYLLNAHGAYRSSKDDGFLHDFH